MPHLAIRFFCCQNVAMRYSVVIPAYNDAKVLDLCLRHLEEVDFDEVFEVVVIDDGSTDNTVEVLLNWQRKAENFELRFESQENLGAAAARNRGVEMCSGDIILFIGADILVSKGWMKEHAKFHRNAVNAVAVGFMTWSPELAKDRFRKFLEEKGIALTFEGLKDNEETDFWHFFTGNISMPKGLFKRFLFDEDFKGYGFEDIMLGYRMSKNGIKIFYLEKAVAWHHHALKESDFFPDRMRKIGESAVLFNEKFPNCGVLPSGIKLFVFKVLAFFSGFLFVLRKEWGWYAKVKKHFLEGVALASAEKSVLIIGSYGAGNLGDEAMLEVILRELPVNYQRRVLSGDVADTKRRHGVKVAPHLPFGVRSFLSFGWLKSLKFLRKSSLVLLGGGGLFTDSYSSKAVYLWAWHVFIARMFGKPVYLFANSFGPVNGLFAKLVVKKVLKACEKIILRDELSKKEVLKFGEFGVVVGFDPVILFCEPIENVSKKKVAINVRPLKEKVDYGEFINDLRSQGYELVFVAMEPMGVLMMKEFGEVVYPSDFNSLIELLNGCEYAVGMRLHFLIAGVLADCKVGGYAYNLKVAGVLDVLDLPYIESGDLSSVFNEARKVKDLQRVIRDAKSIFGYLN